MNSWDEDYLALARFWANARSKDPSTKVGAVIADPVSKEIIAIGYNGFPRGVFDDPALLNDRPSKYARVVHAEVNAILQAGHRARNMNLYCTLFPCNECAKVILQSGIRRVFTPPIPEGRDVGYGVTIEMFRRAGVDFQFLEIPE